MSMVLAAMLLTTAAGRKPASPTFQTVMSSRIVAAARAQLGSSLGSDNAEAQVSVVGKPEDVVVLPGKLALDARRPMGRLPRARVGVPVDIRVDGETVRRATVWFAVSIHRDVLGYSTDAPKGSASGTLKFATENIDIAAVQGDLVTDPTQLTGMRLRHEVLAGSPVLREDFERIPDVDRQERVDVLVSFGSIHMRAKGTALGRGDTGDTVSVLVDGAEAPVRARVTDKGVVEVDQ